MAPVTRRRSKANQLSQEAESAAPSEAPVETGTTIEKKVPARGKRKSSSGEEEEEAEAADDQENTTPKRQKLAVRVRKGAAAKSKKGQSAQIADSEEAEDSDDPQQPTPHSASKQLEDEASQQLDQELRAAAESSTPQPAAAKSKHVVFGDDDDVDNFVSAAKEVQNQAIQEEEDEEEESDDEAPEAVSTTTAAKQSLQAAEAATSAAEKQAASLKRKRQERDNLLKQQAQKRKRAEKPEVHQNKKVPEGQAANADAAIAEIEKAATTSGRHRTEKVALPNHLPAEFLTDSESEDEGDERALRAVKPKKIRFDEAAEAVSRELGQSSARPRDEVIGSTAYRVMAGEGDANLAPRASKNSRSVKDMLLHRRRAGQTPGKTKGFFKRK
ncbi:hypothetical protein BX600DRAFT_515934 [Xylariales sp. PMI_506]|nr:hypothetical protein BX600DRAFT_515934 [Xylariales sp. PMI_506]